MAQLVSQLNIRAKIKLGKHQVNAEEPQQIKWFIVAKNHKSIPEYPTNSVTLLTEQLVDLRSIDAKEPLNPMDFRKTYGNNSFKDSNLLQWLNSNARAGEWYTPKHMYDAPPDSAESINNLNTFYAHRPGFLHYFTGKEIAAILPTTIRAIKYLESSGDYYDDMVAKVFIPSESELNCSSGLNLDGSPWEAITSDMQRRAQVTEQCYNNTLSTKKPSSITSYYTYLIRSANSMDSVSFPTISQAGTASACVPAVTGNLGIRPVVNISGDTLVSDVPDDDGYYTVIFNDAPEITANTPKADNAYSPVIIPYTVTDADSNSLTVTETLNGATLRTLNNQSSGTALTLDLTEQWNGLPYDTEHTVTISAADELSTVNRSWTFVKRAVDVIMYSKSSDGAVGVSYTPDTKPRIRLLFTENIKTESPVWTEASYNLIANGETGYGNVTYAIDVKDGRTEDEKLDETIDMLI